MVYFNKTRRLLKFQAAEQGSSMIEGLIALALAGIITAVFLNGVATTSRGAVITDERATAESLARSQMEWVKNSAYVSGATSYDTAPVSGSDYTGYSVAIEAQAINTGIQRIYVTVNRLEREIYQLEGYKVNR